MRRLLIVASALAFATGCQNATPPVKQPAAKAAPDPAAEERAKVEAARSQLTPEDRAIVDAQEWCVISTDERLGSMGVPIKLMVKDKPVFICCKGCEKKALADPDKTLAKAEELKAKKKTDGGGTR